MYTTVAIRIPVVLLLAGLGCSSDDESGTAPDSAAMQPETEESSAGDARGENVCQPADTYDPIEVNETPPLPADGCADPPTAASSVIELGVAAAAETQAESAAELLNPDVITVVTCGTGSPIASDRVQACTAVFVGGQFLVFDVGDGAQRMMEDLGFPITEIDAIFLTHFHSDHIADLGETISRGWILGRAEDLPVYGGPTVDRVVEGFNLVYTPDEQYRIAHHGEELLPPSTLAAVANRIDGASVEGTVVYDNGGVVVRAYGVDHSPVAPSLGYRVEYGGRSVGISGDTVDSAGLRALAQGADILVSEVLNRQFALDTACAFERTGDLRNAALLRDIRTYHIGVDELGQLAADTDVETLVLTHQVPAVPGSQVEALFLAPIRSVFDGDVIAAEDGTRILISVE